MYGFLVYTTRIPHNVEKSFCHFSILTLNIINTITFVNTESYQQTQYTSDSRDDIVVMTPSMKTMSLLVKKLVDNAMVPTRATEGAAGYDLASVEKIVVPSLGRAAVPLGVSIQVPRGTYGRIAPRSGLAFKYGIDVLAGVIDEDYRGEVKVILYNTGERDYIVNPGDRVAQLIIEKIETPDVATVVEFEESARGSGGFGSTGV